MQFLDHYGPFLILLFLVSLALFLAYRANSKQIGAERAERERDRAQLASLSQLDDRR